MKKRFTWMLIWAAVTVISAGMVSCKPNDPEQEKHDSSKPVYTVMLYTIGGGDLDFDTENDIVNGLTGLAANDAGIRFFVQMKYSDEATYWTKMEKRIEESQGKFSRKDYELYGGKFSTVYRYEALPSMLTKDSANLLPLDIYEYGSQGDAAAFYEPDSIASFIRYCKAQNPEAEKYILILSNHGGGFSPITDYVKANANANAKARIKSGIGYDPQVNGVCINMQELKEGIRKAGLGKKLELLLFDCCLMNDIEILSEVTDVADYALASGHTTTGCSYYELFEQLYAVIDGERQAVDAYRNCAKSFADINYKRYQAGGNISNRYVDWVLTDMNQVSGGVLPALKQFVDAACTAYSKEMGSKSEQYAKYKQASGTAWHYVDNSPLYDLCGYTKALAEVMQDETVTTAHNNLQKAVEAATLERAYADYTVINTALSYSINIGALGYLRYEFTLEEGSHGFGCYDENGSYGYFNAATGEIRLGFDIEDDNPKYAWANSYGHMTFEQQTGWTKWLKLNPAMPFANPPHDDIWDTNGVGDDPDEDEEDDFDLLD